MSRAPLLTLALAVLAAACPAAPKVEAPKFAPAGVALERTPVLTGDVRKALAGGTGFFAPPPDAAAVWGFGRKLPPLDFPGPRAVFVRGLDDLYTGESPLWTGDPRFAGPPSATPLPEPDVVLGADGVATGRFRLERNGQFQMNLNKEPAPNWYFPEAQNIAADTVALELEIPAPLAAGQAELRVALNGNGVKREPNRLALGLNGRSLGAAAQWDGPGYRVVSAPFPAAWARPGKNLVTLKGDGKSVKFLDYVEVAIPCRPRLSGCGLLVAAAAAGALDIPGAKLAADVTVQGQETALPIKDGRLEGLRPGHSYFVAAAAEPLAFGPERALREPPVDKIRYLAVATAAMLPELEPLLQAKRRQGLSVAAVDFADVLDVYGCGRYGPGCLAAFSARFKPEYLLLAGPFNRDCRSRLRPRPLGVPAGAMHTYQWTVTDEPFSNNFATKVGRVFVKTPAELSAWVAKAVAFAPGDTAVLYSGLGVGEDFARSQSQALGKVPSLAVDSDSHRAEEIRAAVVADLVAGATFVAYQGHAQSWSLDKNKAFTSTEPTRFPASNWLLATCNTAYFHADYDDFLPKWLAMPGGGAVNAIAATSLTVPNIQNAVTLKTLDFIASRPDATWGDLFVHLKRNIPFTEAEQRDKQFIASMRMFVTGDVGKSLAAFQLVGDPAAKLWADAPRRLFFAGPKPPPLFGADSAVLEVAVGRGGSWAEGRKPAATSFRVVAEGLDNKAPALVELLGPTPIPAEGSLARARLALDKLPADFTGRLKLCSPVGGGELVWAVLSLRVDRVPPPAPALKLASPRQGAGSFIVAETAGGWAKATAFQARRDGEAALLLDTGWTDQTQLARPTAWPEAVELRARCQDAAGNVGPWSAWGRPPLVKQNLAMPKLLRRPAGRQPLP